MSYYDYLLFIICLITGLFLVVLTFAWIVDCGSGNRRITGWHSVVVAVGIGLAGILCAIAVTGYGTNRFFGALERAWNIEYDRALSPPASP